MSLLVPQPRRLWRLPVNTQDDENRTIPDDRIARVRTALRRVDDRNLVRQAMINRYAVRLQKIQEETGQTNVVVAEAGSGQQVSERLKTQRNEATYAAINAGIFELTRICAADRIIDPSANRFTGVGAGYSYLGSGGPKAGKDVAFVRKRGGSALAEQQWDHVSFSVGSTVLYLSTVDDRICYDIIWIDNFHWVHAGEIVDRETGAVRPVNEKDLDEASVVVIRLAGKAGENKNRYAAWFGACERFPRGRHVVYSSNNWHEIPQPADGGYDYVWSRSGGGRYEQMPMADEIGNPLTIYQEIHKTTGPEYPFVVLPARPNDTSTLCPVAGLAIWDLSDEYDVSASVALYAANKGAIGKEILKPESSLGSKSVPDVNSRMVVLERGWDLTIAGWGPEHAKNAMDVVKDQVRMIAESYHVPSFLAAPDWSQFPAGIALRMARMDMEGYRDQTVEVARPSVARRFDIERALVNFSEGSTAIAPTIEEEWDAGELRWPEEPTEEIEAAQKRLELGVQDLAHVAMDLLDLPSYEAAIKYLEDMVKKAEKHEVLRPKQKGQPVNLAAQTKAGAFFKKQGAADAGQGKEQQPEEAGQGPAPKRGEQALDVR